MSGLEVGRPYSLSLFSTISLTHLCTFYVSQMATATLDFLLTRKNACGMEETVAAQLVKIPNSIAFALEF